MIQATPPPPLYPPETFPQSLTRSLERHAHPALPPAPPASPPPPNNPPPNPRSLRSLERQAPCAFPPDPLYALSVLIAHFKAFWELAWANMDQFWPDPNHRARILIFAHFACACLLLLAPACYCLLLAKPGWSTLDTEEGYKIELVPLYR